MHSKFLDKINCWGDFRSYVEELPNTKSMGDAFEHLTKLYFQINPLYRSKYEEVWLLDEIPSKDLEYLDLPRQDLGIDLIAKSGSFDERLPRDPHNYYKEKGWKGFRDFIGKED